MLYVFIALAVILIATGYYYLKPEKIITKNIFNAEYFRGLNYLLNNEEDKAFKIFTALMDVDSSTIETHLALGGLYRKRGEFDKAILIHQNLLSRPTLENELKNQALYELAKDFQSAGLYDRSEKIFKNLSEINSYNQSCKEHLLKLYEVTKDWEKAINVVNTLSSDNVNGNGKITLLSQYYCEISKINFENSELEKAVAISKKALKVDQNCIRANLQLAKYYSKNDVNISAQYYQLVISQNIDFAKYISSKIIELGKKVNSSDVILNTILSISKMKELPFIPDIYLFLLYEKDEVSAEKYLNYHKMNNPITDFVINHTIALSKPESQSLPVIDNITKSYQKIFSTSCYFLCNNCGYKSHVLNWLCPSCNHWNSIVPKSPIDIIEESSNDDQR
tara:strand:+ start:303 stop:1481 length:1179 start_codon:yes stop_codon:yes gene_type:complete